MSREKLTRDQVEERLRSRESSISERLESIESAVPGKALARVKSMSESTKWKIGAAVGAGLLIGLFFATRKSSKGDLGFEDGMDRLADKLAKRIAHEIKKGRDPDEAVRRAMDDIPPVLNLNKKEQGVIGDALSQFARIAAQQAAKKGASQLLQLLGLDEATGKSQSAASDQESANPSG